MTPKIITQPALPFTVGVSSRPIAPTTRINWLARHLPNPNDQREYAQERCVVAVTEALHDAMEDAGLTQADVAEKLGRTRGYVSRVLNGAHNMTLYTLGDMLWACDVEMRDLNLMPLGEIEVANQDAVTWQPFDFPTGPSPPDDAAVLGTRMLFFRDTFTD